MIEFRVGDIVEIVGPELLDSYAGLITPSNGRITGKVIALDEYDNPTYPVTIQVVYDVEGPNNWPVSPVEIKLVEGPW